MVKVNADRTRHTHPIEGKLIPWNPIEELFNLNSRANALFGRGYGYPPLPQFVPGETGTYEPIVDIYQMEANLECFVALPGFTPENITVEVQPDTLIITCERPPLATLPAKTPAEGWAAVPCNFRFGCPLSMEIDPTHVTATFVNGVLHLVLPLAGKTNVKVTTVPVIAG